MGYSENMDEQRPKPDATVAFGAAAASSSAQPYANPPDRRPSRGGQGARRHRRLRRSRSSRAIAGVCGGLAHYFGVSPMFVRLIFVIGAVAAGPGLVAYLVLWAVVPLEPSAPTPEGPEPLAAP